MQLATNYKTQIRVNIITIKNKWGNHHQVEPHFMIKSFARLFKIFNKYNNKY